MNFFTKSTLLVVGASFLIAPAFAAEISQNSVYIAGDAGYGRLATPNQNLSPVDGVIVTSAGRELGSFAGGVNIGYNRALNPNVLVGAEFGYDYNGRSKYTQTILGSDQSLNIISQDLHLLATGTYLFNNGLNIFAKAGAARVDQKAEVNVDGDSNTDNVVGYKPMVGGGIGYQYKLVNFFVQYSHIFATNGSDNFDDLSDSNGNQKVVTVDTVKAGIAFNFAI